MLNRLGLAAVTLFGVLIGVFLLTRVLPGNPAVLKAGQYATPEVIAKIEHEMGLDRPIGVQLTSYLGQVARGNLGESRNTGHPVVADLKQRIPATVELALFALMTALVVALPLGIWAAVRRGTWVDRFTQGISILGASTPLFWLGLMLIYLFFYRWHIVPAPTGRLDDFMDPPRTVTGLYLLDSLLTGNWATFKSSLGHLLLPGLSLATVEIAPLAKMARAAMRKVLESDYIVTARAMGVPQRRYVLQDALRNALIPVLTMLGIVLGYLIAGSVLVEKIYAWPGLGIYAWNALLSGDFDAIQGVVLVVAISYVFINLAVDLLYAVVDPRIRL